MRWHAMLFVLTLRESLWSAIESRIDYLRGTADLGSLAYLSGGECLLLDVARNLFTGAGAVSLDDLATVLDRHAFETVVAALWLRRGESTPARDVLAV